MVNTRMSDHNFLARVAMRERSRVSTFSIARERIELRAARGERIFEDGCASGARVAKWRSRDASRERASRVAFSRSARFGRPLESVVGRRLPDNNYVLFFSYL